MHRIAICSREKDEAEELLPARKRYLGAHVRKVGEEAERQGRPFFILSGVYGFIPAGELIGFYDHLLVEDEVFTLMLIVRSQLAKHGIRELSFFTKSKPNWRPYLEVLERACEGLDVKLYINMLSDDD